jgi:predicted DNA-binding protein YlxM (UPF0122 family)
MQEQSEWGGKKKRNRLNKEQIDAIVGHLKEGKLLHKEIADIFKISRQAVSDINAKIKKGLIQ